MKWTRFRVIAPSTIPLSLTSYDLIPRLNFYQRDKKDNNCQVLGRLNKNLSHPSFKMSKDYKKGVQGRGQNGQQLR